jgi:hypothetical protein
MPRLIRALVSLWLTLVRQGKWTGDLSKSALWGTNWGRLALFILAYNLGNLRRRLVLPEALKDWSLHSVQVKLIKIGGRLVGHARRLTFQLAEVAVPREVFRGMLERTARLCPVPG